MSCKTIKNIECDVKYDHHTRLQISKKYIYLSKNLPNKTHYLVYI